MKRFIVAAALLSFTGFGALADMKPTEDEAAKMKAAIEAWGCTGGEFEKEDEATGKFEIDDAKCKDGQFDFKLDKDFKVLSMTRD